MKLRGIGFSPNGQGDLLGTIIVYSDNDEALGIENTGNYSRDADKSLYKKAKASGLDLEVMRAQLTRLLAQIRTGTDEAIAANTPQLQHDRQVVYVSDRHMRDISDDCWELIEGANGARPRFFCFGDGVVDLVVSKSLIRPRLLSLASLRGHLDRLGDFIAIGEKLEEKPARPPKDVVEDLLAFANPPMPYLRAVVGCPIVAPDGSIISSDGYHPKTCFYLALNGLQISPVPANPAQDDIERARNLILGEILGEFPFVTDADKAHAVAALINPVARAIIDGPTPLYIIEAPTPGSGKGLLAEVISIVTTGNPPSVMTEGHDDDEWRKRITARLLSAPPIILIDNIRRRLESSALSAALTARFWEDRYLGQTRIVTVPVTTTWLATGNNPALSDEIARRIIRIRLDTGMEHPWEREGFRHPNLRQWVQRNRAEILWAVLTLIRTWVVAGRPRGAEVMGSFESYAATMGGILHMAGIQGFLTNRQEVYAHAQSEAEGWQAFVNIWWETYQSQRVGVEQLFKLSKENKLLTDLRADRTDRGARTSMGIALSKMRDRLIGLYYLRYTGPGLDGRAANYCLELSGGNAKVRLGSEVRGGSDTQVTEPQNLTVPLRYPQQFWEDFHSAPKPGTSCICPDMSGPPIVGDELPACPSCGRETFWCPICGGCRLCEVEVP